MKLRPYQTHAIDAVMRELEDNQSTLVVMPTGTGKTVLFAHIIERWKNGRAMVLAHREELIYQAASKIQSITGEEPDIEMADRRADSSIWKTSRVVVSSIQTQISGTPARMTRFAPGEFGLVIIDEAHHATAESYRKVIAHYSQNPRTKIVGVTATPDRADEQALGRVFDSVAFVYEITDAINDGYLVPIQQRSVTISGLDYSGARTTAGDLNQADVAKAQSSERVLHEVAHPIVELAGNRKTIVFATPGDSKEGDFKISERLTEIINRHKPESARRVSMDTPKDLRRQMLLDYSEGRFQFLVNVGVLTEGFDEPGIEVVAITRPTKSRALFAQMIGRGTRPLPGIVDGIEHSDVRRHLIGQSKKPFVEVLDFEGNSGRHKLVHTADVLGGNYEDEVVQRATKRAKEDGGDVMQHLADAAAALEEERRRAEQRRRSLVAVATYETELIDPFNVFDIATPHARGWDVGHGVTEKQRAMLESNGVPVAEGMTRRQASAIIEEIMARRRSGRVGFRQARKLKARGFSTDVSVGQAMNLLRGVSSS